MTKRKRNKIIIIICSILAILLIILSLGIAFIYKNMEDVAMQPIASSEVIDDNGHAVVTQDKNGFTDVDWNHVNDDADDGEPIIGWIDVPGTKVNFPIVRGRGTYFLHHDRYGKYSAFGTIYLDDDSDGGLLDSDNGVIFGHHMLGGKMFAPLSNYSNRDWAQEHPIVCIQTAEHKVIYQVCASRIINANNTKEITNFASVLEYKRWQQSEWNNSGMQLNEFSSDRNITLVTCSYNFWKNERTITYIQPINVDGTTITSTEQLQYLLGKTQAEKNDDALRTK